MNCGICGSGDATRRLAAGRHTLVACRSCGLVYNPDFEPSEAAYAGDEYFTRKTEYVSRWDEFCALFAPLVARIREFKPAGLLLDVGAGVGALMATASRNGYVVKGIEISEWASDYARRERGLDVATGTLEDARFDDESFDVVVLNHVLEHVGDPRGMLSEIRRILRKDGLLVVGVPNIGSIMARLLGARWASLRLEEHIWHFTPPTLGRIVSDAGFEVVLLESRDNNPVAGWSPKDILRRAINAVSVVTNRSEAMVLFATRKQRERA